MGGVTSLIGVAIIVPLARTGPESRCIASPLNSVRRATADTCGPSTMSSSGETASSCSAMYHSTPAARAGLDDRREVEGPLPCRNVARPARGHGPSCAATGPGGARRDRRRIPAADGRPVDVDLELDLGRRARRAGCPRPSSRRGARTRTHGCGTRAGGRARRSARSHQARRRTDGRRRPCPGPRQASTARRSAGTRGREPIGDGVGSSAGGRCPRATATTASPASSSSPRELAGPVSGNPASSTARSPLRDGRERPGQVRPRQWRTV